MRLYVAGPWADREYMPNIAELLQMGGHTITHKWWETEIKEAPSHEDLQLQAAQDWNGVSSAEVVVLINSKKSEGKAVEQGLALAYGIPILAVGKLGSESKNVFHHLGKPFYYWVDNISEAIEILREVSNAKAQP